MIVFFKKDQKKSQRAVKASKVIDTAGNNETDLYALNRYQLKNLLDKNVYFRFFQVESFSFSYDRDIEYLLKKVKQKTKEELLMELKNQDLKQPLVLICNKGFVSQKLAQKLQNKGFVNAYCIAGGLKGLLEYKD